jgi:hypothetical protein
MEDMCANPGNPFVMNAVLPASVNITNQIPGRADQPVKTKISAIRSLYLEVYLLILSRNTYTV